MIKQEFLKMGNAKIRNINDLRNQSRISQRSRSLKIDYLVINK